MEVSEFESEFDKNGRYVMKDIVLLLRERFSPLYGSNLWGRDQFKISKLPNRDYAVDDLITQMATSLQQMVEEMATMVNGRLDNRYDDVANSISISVANRVERIDSDEIRAATLLNLANLKMDAEIGDRWKYIRMYGQACDNFITLFNIHEDIRYRLHNTIALGETLYDSIDRRRELDMGVFELKAQLIGIEQAESTRIQAENTDRLSTLVAILTGVATILAIFQFIGDEVDPRFRLGCYVGSLVIVAIIILFVHMCRKKSQFVDKHEKERL